MYNEYSAYNPGAPQVQNPVGGGGSGGASSIIPGVSLALGGLGLLSNIYGAYQQNKQAKKQYRLQLAEFNRQKAIDDEQRRLAEEQRKMDNQSNAGAYASGMDNNRLAKYSGYFRGIGY